MDEVKHLRYAQALQARFGQLNERLGPVTHQVQHPNTTLEPKGVEGGPHQADEPMAAFFGFPQPGLWMTVSPFDALSETIDTALGQPGLMGNVSDARLGVVIKRVENQTTLSPKSHV